MSKKVSGLAIYMKNDDAVYIIVGGEAIEIRMVRISPGSCRMVFNADRDKVKIYREKYLRRTHEKANNGVRGIHREQPDEKDSEGEQD